MYAQAQRLQRVLNHHHPSAHLRHQRGNIHWLSGTAQL